MTTPDHRALVLLSGGLDSTTLLAQAMQPKFNATIEVAFVNYGQRHIRERESSIAVAKHYDVPWHELDLTGFGRSVKSALTRGGCETEPVADVPHGHYAADNMALTVVPGRNAVFLSAAAGLAASRGLKEVLTAVHAGDHPIYPDCRPDFILAIGHALSLAYGVIVQAPFVSMTKAEIAGLAADVQAPVKLSWSCYEGGAIHCGRCGTCVERAEAFHLANLADPTQYADPEYWRVAVGA